MSSSNPWDPIPVPRGGEGDATADVTYTSIGRALTAWELFEMKFVEVFVSTVSNGAPHHQSTPARRAYGSILTFKGRHDMVRVSFDALINELAHNHATQTRAPYSKLEAEFKVLLNRSVDFSARRNEIAHGYVREWQGLHGESYGYALFPTTYASGKNKQAEPGEAKYLRNYEWPNYIYSSVEIDGYAKHFSNLEKMCHDFWLQLLRIDQL